VPRFDFVRSFAEQGLVPGGSRTNLAYVEPSARFDPELDEIERLVLADAQTSGGLLIAVPPENEAQLVAELGKQGTLARAVIGEIVEGEAGNLEVVTESG
jgi:selenide,water dikinase